MPPRRAKKNSSDEDPDWAPPPSKKQKPGGGVPARAAASASSSRPALAQQPARAGKGGKSQPVRQTAPAAAAHLVSRANNQRPRRAAAQQAMDRDTIGAGDGDDLFEEWNLSAEQNVFVLDRNRNTDGSLYVKNVQARAHIDVAGGLDLEAVHSRFWNAEVTLAGSKSASSSAGAAAAGTAASINSLKIMIYPPAAGGEEGDEEAILGNGRGRAVAAGARPAGLDIAPEDDGQLIYTKVRAGGRPIVVTVYPSGALTLVGDLRPRGGSTFQDQQSFSGFDQQQEGDEELINERVHFEFEAAMQQIKGRAREYLKKVGYMLLASDEELYSNLKMTAGGVPSALSSSSSSIKVLRDFKLTNVWAYCRLPYGLDLRAIAKQLSKNASYNPDIAPTLKLTDFEGVQSMRVFHTGMVEFYSHDEEKLLRAARIMRNQWKRFDISCA